MKLNIGGQMKNKLLLILFLATSICYSQLYISTDYREVETWDGEEWGHYSSGNEKTIFEFEDTSQSKMGMFVHRTDDITSAYLIKSYVYNSEYSLDEFKVVSDVGNKYTLLVNINWDEDNPSGFLTFLYLEGDGSDFRSVRHRIDKIWRGEDKEDNSNAGMSREQEIDTEETDLYDGNFSFENYFMERGNLDPIEGVWSLSVVRKLYLDDELIHEDSEQNKSEWAVAFDSEGIFKVYGIDEEAEFTAYFNKTSFDGIYNYECSFISPSWDAEATATLEGDNDIIRYGYFVDDVFLRQIDSYERGMKLYWEFTWNKKFPDQSINYRNNSGCVSGDCEDGYGEYHFSGKWQGDIYIGDFKNGKFHGYGTYSRSQGDKYEGYWKYGDQHGQGRYTFADGDIYEGEFEDGEFIGDKNDNSMSNNSGWKANGTGFFIDDNGYIATNYHVVEDANYLEIEFYRDGDLQVYEVEVVKDDKNNDLAILKIIDPNFQSFDEIPYNFSTRVADLGEEVFALGYPMALTLMGKDIKFTDGKVSSKTGYDGDISNYQTTTPIQGGNSGGPLFDYNGNLIAINASILRHDIADNVSYSIKSSYLKNLVDVLPVKLNLPDDRKIKDYKLTDKIKLIQDYVVLIKIR